MYATALRERQRVAWARFFEDYDVALAPVMPTTAFPHDTDGQMTDRRLDIGGTAPLGPLTWPSGRPSASRAG